MEGSLSLAMEGSLSLAMETLDPLQTSSASAPPDGPLPRKFKPQPTALTVPTEGPVSVLERDLKQELDTFTKIRQQAIAAGDFEKASHTQRFYDDALEKYSRFIGGKLLLCHRRQ